MTGNQVAVRRGLARGMPSKSAWALMFSGLLSRRAFEQLSLYRARGSQDG